MFLLAFIYRTRDIVYAIDDQITPYVQTCNVFLSSLYLLATFLRQIMYDVREYQSKDLPIPVYI
jgi:hypothetical protein